MELKEYILIFKKNLGLFVTVVILVIVAGILFQLFRPISYKSSITLNVTRTGFEETQEYRYDNFYRLQADERFADTVVRWLGSPGIVTDILGDAGLDSSKLSQWKLSRFFNAKRLSSQVIEVNFIRNDVDTAKKLSESLVRMVNIETDKLNEIQREENWFMVLGSDPVVKQNKIPWGILLLSSIAIGIFLGFWSVYIRHYLNR